MHDALRDRRQGWLDSLARRVRHSLASRRSHTPSPTSLSATIGRAVLFTHHCPGHGPPAACTATLERQRRAADGCRCSCRFDDRAGVPRPLFPIAGYRGAANRQQDDVAPDGQRFLMIRQPPGNPRPELIYAENWFEELSARMKGSDASGSIARLTIALTDR